MELITNPMSTHKHLANLFFTIVTALSMGAASEPAPADQTMSTDKHRFIEQMSTQHGFNSADVRDLLAQARHDDKALRRIKNPAEALEWHQYRQIFLTPERIRSGVDYWREHADKVANTVNEYGVEAHILIAILGVESYYGKRSGDHRVLDALSTLAFSYPPRGSFFRNELEAFLLLTKQHGLDPKKVYGSYAGAMGKPQFISSSYNHYAVSADGDERADLFNSAADALASIANYLAQHGWIQGGPLAHKTESQGTNCQGALAPLNRPVKPEHLPKELTARGVDVPGDIDSKDKLGLIKLNDTEESELWLTHNNFYVLTRYNHSALYAMAVYQLAKAILEEHQSW
mgnify:CR=1 FL=1